MTSRRVLSLLMLPLWPFLIIWSVSILFQIEPEYSFRTWLAAELLLCIAEMMLMSKQK